MTEIEREVKRQQWRARQRMISACAAVFDALSVADAQVDELGNGAQSVLLGRHIWRQAPDADAAYVVRLADDDVVAAVEAAMNEAPVDNGVIAAVEAALNAAYVERYRAVVMAARRLAGIDLAMRADPAGTQSLRERRDALVRDLVAAVVEANA